MLVLEPLLTLFADLIQAWQSDTSQLGDKGIARYGAVGHERLGRVREGAREQLLEGHRAGGLDRDVDGVGVDVELGQITRISRHLGGRVYKCRRWGWGRVHVHGMRELLLKAVEALHVLNLLDLLGMVHLLDLEHALDELVALDTVEGGPALLLLLLVQHLDVAGALLVHDLQLAVVFELRGELLMTLLE